MSETKTKNLCTVPAADLTDSQYFIAEDGGELKRIPKAQVVLKKLENMLATDTENLAGGGEVTAQELLDALAEQVANKLLAKSQVVNNLLATVEGNPLDATQGKALKELIDTTNNNLSKAIISSDLFADYSSPTFVRWNYKTANTPYKAGLTYGQEGFALVFGSVSGWHTVISWLKGGRNMWAHYVSEGTDYGWSEYAQKSDLTGLDATLSIREENGGVIVSFGSKDSKYGIYIGVGPNGVNANYKINGEWKKAIIIATKS
ncbi:MAG: hypothetical protein ACLU48_13090 [Clostridiaceae bacterium]